MYGSAAVVWRGEGVPAVPAVRSVAALAAPVPAATALTVAVVVVQTVRLVATASMGAAVPLAMDQPVETLTMAARVPAADRVDPARMGEPVAVMTAAAVAVLATRR